ncbi:MAG TPA: dienelactone hydrolase family protein [Pseudomonadales bacterium]|nr:dienelactone hydrolase family protein [Pseudomonadales bacterium]
MGEKITLTASDGFELDAWLAKPEGEPKGGVLVIQEIFGVNNHIREVTDGFAADGYAALAPAIFDRAGKGIELGYEGDDITRGATIARGQLDMTKTMADLQAGIDYLGQYGKVGVVGYCFGGLLTWLCACNATGVACASGYYGGGIAGMVDLKPKVPTILHFGEKDAHIPMTDVNKIKDAHPEVTVYVYEADHGFNCDHRASYDEAASKLARSRTLAFFAEHL